MNTESRHAPAATPTRRVLAEPDDRWVLISVVTEYTGYTDYAIRAKIRNGKWSYRAFWRRAPDARLVFNLTRIQRWMSGDTAG